MTHRIHQVDAFTRGPFQGNPAAVCVLDDDVSDTWMQSVAAEMNLSETAFVRPAADGFDLRWFTPTREVRLCGHATMASAHVLWESGRIDSGRDAVFRTRSGRLTAVLQPNGIRLDLPAIRMQEAPLPAGAAEALGAAPRRTLRTVDTDRQDLDYLLELGSEAELRELQPDFARLREAAPAGFIATVRTDEGEYDFVSRYFAPYWGIDEDPATGAAHCCLAPFWSPILGRPTLSAHQASRRGGWIEATVEGDRVLLTGKAVTVMVAELLV